ncbi:hypothetical protein Goarm_021499 [Gossypium armourianum]|uniref:Uncharacterized protein n=1 Tax=Gossypium armourianum TaxID=34283 RepID=A0A7J9IRY1_9ROSI|nr:hypothetical protein [Gossypium armourianum]
MHLYCKLHSLQKGALSMRDYLSQIREGCDTLAACSSPILAIKHNSAILNGLPHDHDFFVAVITSSLEPYTFDRVASILMDAESRLQEPFRFPMSINTTQVTAPSLINIDSTLRLKLPTSSSSGFFSPFSSQAHFSGSVTPTHFVPRPRFLYLNRGRGRTTYYLQCQLCGNMRHLVDHYYYCFNQSFLGIQSFTPTKPAIVNPIANICIYSASPPNNEFSSHAFTSSDGYYPFVQHPTSDSMRSSTTISTSATSNDVFNFQVPTAHSTALLHP